ncbi:MAG: pilus assembly protein TadG-related protein [Desulfobulbaceae bacterium]|nr:pilus assembly protein TadG-related protein [Desulfobulbaceae bacterium]
MTSFNHKGQASVFVLALIGVVLVSAVFLFESGRLTSEKMQLQNAADAAAFGASTLEARSLNFAAYTNRAMVANEVAIGQMVGILSFIDELKTSGEYLDAYADVLFAVSIFLEEIGVGEVIDAFAEVLENLGEGLIEVGEEIEEFIKPIASASVKGLSIINTVYSASQNVFHGATLILEATTILQSIEDNVPGTTKFDLVNMFDPGKQGAQLSDLGILALACHIPSYWSGHTKRYTTAKSTDKKDDKDEEKELKPYEQKVKKDREQLQTEKNKYQEIIKQYQKKKIAFESKKQECNTLEQNCKADKKKYKNDCDRIHKCTGERDKLQKETAALEKQKNREEAKIQAYQNKLDRDQNELEEKQKEMGDDDGKDGEGLNDGMKRLAATIRKARDPFTSGDGPILDDGWFGKQEYYNRNWNFGLGVGVDFHVWLLGKFGVDFYTGLDSKGGSEIRHKGDSYTWSAVDTAVFETKVELTAFSKTIDIDPALPLGGGGYQATGKSGEGEEDGLSSQLTVVDMPPTLGYFGKPKAYGGAGYPYGRWLSWEGAAVELTDEDNVLNNTYSGLQPYRDINDATKTASGFSIEWPWTSPFFLVGVIRKMDDITKTSAKYKPDEAPHFSGNLDLIDDIDNEIVDRAGAIAKSEVYFNRPTDLRYFLRHDKKKENPNVFSPFWQARLVKTSDTDRLLAMAIQHKKIWLAKKDADALPGLEKVMKELEKILKYF